MLFYAKLFKHKNLEVIEVHIDQSLLKHLVDQRKITDDEIIKKLLNEAISVALLYKELRRIIQ